MNLKIHSLFLLSCMTVFLAGCNMPDMKTAKLADRRQDYATSVQHYQELADFGHPEAQTQLAKHYMHGNGVKQDPEKALALFEKAKKAGMGTRVIKDIATAKTQIASAVLTGKSNAVSKDQAIAFLNEAAQAGDRRAYFELGNAYEKGLGVTQDTNKALGYYEQAGSLGYGRADYNRAVIYEKGKLVPQNLTLALALYKSAADKGYQRANLALGKLYEKGMGVEPNPPMAQAYYKKADVQTAENTSKE